jgi:hypothetical protein
MFWSSSEVSTGTVWNGEVEASIASCLEDTSPFVLQPAARIKNVPTATPRLAQMAPSCQRLSQLTQPSTTI